MRQFLRAAATALIALCTAPSAAEEGMWTFNRFPAARMERELGWAPEQAWLDAAMAGVARLPGCSASNVSADGLILTNHHCVISCIGALSSAEANYIEAGFRAPARAEERRCPNLSVSLLLSVSDVTARIDAASAAIAAEGFARARDSEIARIQEECTTGPVWCEVVTLYQGGRYGLYTYRRFDDVRLAFAPERAMAAFGGDSDNFSFPRYCIDFAFLRLYQDGLPARTPRHLSLRFTPAAEGEIVLSAGNPGATSRLRTVAELAFERNVTLPWRLSLLQELRARYLAYADAGADQARLAAGVLQGVENSIQVLAGRRLALANTMSLARVAAQEADLQARVQRNRASAREVGDSWGVIARAQRTYAGFYAQHQLLEAGAGQRSDLFLWARDIVRGAAERAKPDSERMARYSDARIGGVVNNLRATRPVAGSFERLNLEIWLSKLHERLGDEALAQRVLGGEGPAALAARLAGSNLADPAYRMSLWAGGADVVAASEDPMIAFVRAWDGDARAVRARFQAEVERPVALAQELIARARFRSFGEEHYPEASFSPRLSYGRILGWTEPGGAAIAPFTRVGGLYERASGAAPYELSPPWIEAQAQLNSDTIFNLTSSNDITGGNSGSPLLGRDGRVIGVMFDGNMHSNGGEYFYDGELNRAVTVSAAIIRVALRDVYDMQMLADELENAPLD
ncbi:MAG: S46 family peptidase [Terricaulis sp.]